MKKTLIIGLFVGLLSLPGAMANTLTVTWGVNHSPSGGEFIVATSANGTFKSFCIEYPEHINPFGAPVYYYSLSDGAVAGGLSGGNPDPVSIGTAWLFKQFTAGTLAGYSSTFTNQNNLQNAFWWLEGELGVVGNNLAYAYASNPYLIAAKTALSAGTFGDLQADAGANNFGVRVVNIFGDAQHLQNQQDMLIVPDGGFTLMLIGIGMGIMGFMARRARR